MGIIRFFINLNFLLQNTYSFLTLKREKRIGNILLKNKLKISTAESCTAGLISSRLTDISGSSNFISQNFVTYSNGAKVNLLEVKNETIEKYGVVSEQVALEMAFGLLKKYDCDIALSITGIMGPLGGTKTKPVGLFCTAVASKTFHTIRTYKLNPLLYRRIMKYASSNKSLDLLSEFLNEYYKMN